MKDMNPRTGKGRSEHDVPADLRKALSASPKAKAQWSGLTPIARRDFVRWIVSAKRAETRAKRIAVACSKLVAGKRRPCCYAVVPMGLYRALDANPKAKARWSRLTPDERRDLVDWVDAADGPEDRSKRIEKACVKLAA